MNVKETKKAIEVMQAYVSGKAIQVRAGISDWKDSHGPHWNWGLCEYRTKPEPVIVYANVYTQCTIAHTSQELARKNADPRALEVAVPFVRVSDVALLDK